MFFFIFWFFSSFESGSFSFENFFCLLIFSKFQKRVLFIGKFSSFQNKCWTYFLVDWCRSTFYWRMFLSESNWWTDGHPSSDPTFIGTALTNLGRSSDRCQLLESLNGRSSRTVQDIFGHVIYSNDLNNSERSTNPFRNTFFSIGDRRDL